MSANSVTWSHHTLETGDDALSGVHRPAPRPSEVMARLGPGEPVAPARYYFRTTPRFECGHPDDPWRNGVVNVARVERHADGVVLDLVEVSRMARRLLTGRMVRRG